MVTKLDVPDMTGADRRSYRDAVALVSRSDQFDVGDEYIDGRHQRIFKAAPSSLRELFGRTRSFGDRTCLVFEDERWSFDDLHARIDALGAALVRQYGFRRGDRVAIAMRNLPEWVATFAAVTSVGCVSVSLNAWWTPAELDSALADCRPRLLVCDEQRAERAGPACRRLGIEIVVVRPALGLASGARRWDELTAAGGDLPPIDVSAVDDATIVYTSGTTGRPKGAVSTHRAVMQALYGFGFRAAVEAAMRPAGPRGPRVEHSYILVMPLFHVTGCIPVMLGCLTRGLKLVMMDRWNPERALELIERERVTVFIGVPTQSWDLLRSPRFAETDTSSLRVIGGGGAAAPPSLIRRMASSTSGSPNLGYGMTETNAYGPGISGPECLGRPTSTGRATPILDIAVRDGDGRDVPSGVTGEIWLRSPALMRGYWRDPQATAASLVEGWLRTGDVGHLDGEGYLYIEDRAKDIIIRGGENISSAEVEAACYEHPAVHEVAVVGLPHERLGEEVAAIVVPKVNSSLDPAGLQEFVAGRLAAFKVPARVAVVDGPLPRSAVGKVLKRELPSRFREA